MTFLLEGFVAQIRQAMERAVEDDAEVRKKKTRLICLLFIKFN